MDLDRDSGEEVASEDDGVAEAEADEVGGEWSEIEKCGESGSKTDAPEYGFEPVRLPVASDCETEYR